MMNQQGDNNSSAESEASSTSALSPETRVTRLSNAADGYNSLIDVTGKIGLLLFSLCYGLGLVIVNVHLGKYGIYSHSLLRLDYIMAGLWALGLLTISWLLIFVAYIGIIGPPDFLKQDPRIPGYGYRLLAFFFFLIILIFLGTLDLPLGNWNFLSKVIVISLLVLSPYLTYGPKSFLALSTTLAFFLGYMVIFVTEFYEHIPSRLGGGGPMQGQLVIEADAAYADFLRDKGIYLNASERRKQIETTSRMRDSQTDKNEGARSEPKPNNNLGFGQEAQDLSQTGRVQAKQEENDGQPQKITYQTTPLKVLAVTDKEYIVIGISKGRNDYQAVSIPRELVKAVLSAN